MSRARKQYEQGNIQKKGRKPRSLKRVAAATQWGARLKNETTRNMNDIDRVYQQMRALLQHMQQVAPIR